MFDRHWLYSLLVGLMAVVPAASLCAEDPKAPAAEKPAAEKPAAEVEPPKFVQITRDEDKRPLALQTAIVRYELAKQAAALVNKPGPDGETPLHKAAAKGHLDVVKKLLEAGARPDAENKKGLTPLHLAAENGQIEVVKLLVEASQKAGAKQPAAGPAGLTVDLVGVVHIGEKDYYEKLNDMFKQYDVLLYELVAEPNTRVPRDAKNRTPGHPVAWLQAGMKDMLELDFQLHHIDYHQKNFVHADMSPEEVAESMTKKGESIWKMMAQSMAQGMAQANRGNAPSDAEVLMAMFAKDRALRLKRIFARQFEDLEEQMKIFGGPEGSTIITERNKKALEVMADQIKDGKLKIGIFYGAGHMPDFHERLVSDFGLTPTNTAWLDAWDLRDSKQETANDKE